MMFGKPEKIWVGIIAALLVCLVLSLFAATLHTGV